MTLIIKNAALLIGCIFFQHRLLNMNFKSKQLTLYICLLPLLTITSSYVDLKESPLNTPFIILCGIVLLHIYNKKSLYVSITTTALSFALSYSFHVIASIALGFVCIATPYEVNPIVIQSLCFVLHMLLIPLPFRFARLKRGMPFLENPTYSLPGAYLGIVILFISAAINNQTYHITLVTLILTIPLLALCLYQYWQQCITKTYKDKLTLRNLGELNQALQTKEQELRELREEKNRLEKIVHKDNKLIPAMELAVRNFLKHPAISDETVRARGQALLNELHRLSKERKGILQEQELQCTRLIPTNITSIDNLLHYLQQDAYANHITLQTSITCDLNYFIKYIITEEDLNTLLADLLRNAIIATTHNHGHYILLSIHLLSDIYAISVFDSGIPFTPEVLANWGRKRITTHAEEDGNGIGLMTTYELTQKYHSSFVIHELNSQNQSYTKEVSIVFNTSEQYTLITNRSREKLSVLSTREDLQIIYE